MKIMQIKKIFEYLPIIIIVYLVYIFANDYINNKYEDYVFIDTDNNIKIHIVSNPVIQIPKHNELYKEKERGQKFSLQHLLRSEKLYICEFGSNSKYKIIDDTYCIRMILKYGQTNFKSKILINFIKTQYEEKLKEL
ncbi:MULTISPECIES: hypothetical protein [unclassified Campylobacter]|uniref:hypothetical protein n=1 Tax=unclassified Campylobacter TaxID=2593542 RepID=UPI001DF71AE3|nr:hypothetical protein [Campylobacter sp. RM12651]MBZ7978516.1 hypothetical protein [Campylobacter sp. RM12654]MBZ7990592.1 hypothetical protein [Campylobacter sp. RM9331]MBZ8004769.1 hypothetical protein [Campylobacter sp. RM9332]ULO04422.1 hypothetical protein AVBRAN_1993 [Campylobacter sp. RM12651]